MKESILTAKIIKYLRSRGCFVVKWHGSVYGAGGMPDIYALVPSMPYAIPLHIEVKLPGNTPTPRQLKVLDDLQRARAIAVWVSSLEQVHKVFRQLKATAMTSERSVCFICATPQKALGVWEQDQEQTILVNPTGTLWVVGYPPTVDIGHTGWQQTSPEELENADVIIHEKG